MALRTHSTASLRRKLARREAGATNLPKKRNKLAKALAAMDAELASLDASGVHKRRDRLQGCRAGPPTGRL